MIITKRTGRGAPRTPATPGARRGGSRAARLRGRACVSDWGNDPWRPDFSRGSLSREGETECEKHLEGTPKDVADWSGRIRRNTHKKTARSPAQDSKYPSRLKRTNDPTMPPHRFRLRRILLCSTLFNLRSPRSSVTSRSSLKNPVR